MVELNIISAVLGPVSTNCYTVSNVQTKDTVIIDPADSGDHLVAMIEDQVLVPKAILLTHGHFDHCMAVPRLKEEYPEIEIIIGKDDVEWLKDPMKNLSKCSAFRFRDILPAACATTSRSSIFSLTEIRCLPAVWDERTSPAEVRMP